jgi:hypothetical protein
MRPATMLRCWLGEIGAAPEEVVSMVVAVSEAWQSAIELGHDFAHVPVNVRFQREGDEAFATLRDAGGRGRPPGDRDRGGGIEFKGGLMDDTRLGLGSHRGSVAVLRRRHRGARRGPAAGSGGRRRRVGQDHDAVADDLRVGEPQRLLLARVAEQALAGAEMTGYTISRSSSSPCVAPSSWVVREPGGGAAAAARVGGAAAARGGVVRGSVFLANQVVW